MATRQRWNSWIVLRRTTAKAFAADVLTDQERKQGDRRGQRGVGPHGFVVHNEQIHLYVGLGTGCKEALGEGVNVLRFIVGRDDDGELVLGGGRGGGGFGSFGHGGLGGGLR